MGFLLSEFIGRSRKVDTPFSLHYSLCKFLISLWRQDGKRLGCLLRSAVVRRLRAQPPIGAEADLADDLIPGPSGPSPGLPAHYQRMMARPAVTRTLEVEAAIGYHLPV